MGFTNRSASEPALPGGGQQDPGRALSARQPESARSTPRLATDPAAPVSRGSARRPPPSAPGGLQHRLPSSGQRSGRAGGNPPPTFTNPAPSGEDRPMQRAIREKTWGRQLNMGAELRNLAVDGYVKSSQVASPSLQKRNRGRGDVAPSCDQKTWWDADTRPDPLPPLAI